MYIIPILDEVLKKSLKKKPYYKYTEREINELYQSIILLNMNFLSVCQFKRNLKFLDKDDLKRLSTNIRLDSTLMLKFRGFLFYIIQNSITERQQVLESFKLYGLTKGYSLGTIYQNLKIIPFLNETKILYPYFAKIKKLPPALTPKQVEDLCVKVVKQIKPYLQAYVYKKLRFLISSDYLTMEDLVSTLISNVCINCYNLQGKIRGKHLLNSLKVVSANTGKNIIQYYTSKARRRLESNDDGFTNKVQSINIVDDNGEENDFLNLLGQDGDYQQTENQHYLSNYYIMLLNRYGEDSKIVKFFKILTNTCDEFVAWYNGKRKNRHYVDVYEIQEVEKNRFTTIIKIFLKVSESTWRRLVQIIKPMALDYMKGVQNA